MRTLVYIASCKKQITNFFVNKRDLCSIVLNNEYKIKGCNASNAQVIFKRFTKKKITVPEMAESITEGTIYKFLKNEGDYIYKDELLTSIETDKIDVDVISKYSGTITKILVKEGSTVVVGQELAIVDTNEKKSLKFKAVETEVQEDTKIAVEDKKNLSEIVSPNEKVIEKKTNENSSQTQDNNVQKLFSRLEERVKMNRMRLRISERLKESQNNAAFLTTFNEVDMSSLIEMRKKFNEDLLEKFKVKLGFMGPFSKACALAAIEIPSINACIENNDTIVYRDFMDISVAVATPKGLVTPFVKNVESLSIIEIEKKIAYLGKKARDGKLSLEEISGGTFTISNGGVFGSLNGTPIINTPQSAVLGLHGVKERPVVINGQIIARPMMNLALTYDHRILDGREAVTFLTLVKLYIEDPRKMLLI